VNAFARDWLELRAPYDAAARSVSLARAFAAALPPCPHIVDLAAGSGANRRWLGAHVARSARWTLVDHDPALLEGVADARLLDLGTGLEDFTEGDAATCSAFLDLVSADWLRRLVAWLRGRPLLAALSVDGRVRFTPGDLDDAAVVGAFAADQRRDKGLGPALGPDAPRHLISLLRNAGYRVDTAPSDWELGPEDGAMLAGMIDGFAAITPAAERWAARRRAQAKAGELGLLVGHVDVLARR
jgi:hypothetical protein